MHGKMWELLLVLILLLTLDTEEMSLTYPPVNSSASDKASEEQPP